MLGSQRIESVIDFSGSTEKDITPPTKRGEAPTLIEMFILSWVSGEANNFYDLYIFFSLVTMINTKSQWRQLANKSRDL